MATKKGTKRTSKKRTNKSSNSNANVLLGVLALVAACILLGLFTLGGIWLVKKLSLPATTANQPASAPADSAAPAALYEHSGPTTGEAKEALGLDVQRLDTEVAAFVWRGSPNSAKVRCAEGYVCTLHLGNGKIMVVQGDGKYYTILAGTFRFVDAYPAEDAVHRPCELVAKEQDFGRLEDPSFTVWTNLSCSK